MRDPDAVLCELNTKLTVVTEAIERIILKEEDNIRTESTLALYGAIVIIEQGEKAAYEEVLEWVRVHRVAADGEGAA